MNRDFMKYVEERLNQWADWYSHGNWYGQGYSSSSIEYRLMMEGCVIRCTASKQLPWDTEAEEIEILIKEMAVQNYNMALALRYHYFTSGGLRVKAKRIDISHTQFKLYVDMAHQWLAGRLSSQNTILSRHACNGKTKLI